MDKEASPKERFANHRSFPAATLVLIFLNKFQVAAIVQDILCED